ncbi:hypothetical protein Tco_1520506 [Tanacetum coccineum]
MLGVNPIPHRLAWVVQFDPVDYHDYPSRGYHVISCVDYILHLLSRTDIGAEASRDKEFNQAARDSNDALVCCVENTVEDRIMDYGASFHATYCKEELERFKLRSGKVRLAYDMNLDIASVKDVVLKTYLGTS